MTSSLRRRPPTKTCCWRTTARGSKNSPTAPSAIRRFCNWKFPTRATWWKASGWRPAAPCWRRGWPSMTASVTTWAAVFTMPALFPEDRGSGQRHSGGNSKHMIARLKPGATLAQAQAQIDAQNATLEADDPEAKMMAEAGFRSVVAPLPADRVGRVRPALLWMQAGAFALLLIGAVNLTNLLLIRASRDRKSTAVRQALGASRLHVVSEVVVETTLLTLAGGLLGLAAGAGGIRLLSVLGADRLPLGSHIAFDARLACVAVLGAVVMGLALAVPIAWFNLRGRLASGI